MKKLLINCCRLVLALVFILSGFVKAVDPLGTQYKIVDYLEAMHLGGMMPDVAALALSVGLSAVEFCLGIFLLFAIRRRFTARCVLAFMLVMTPLTLWLALTNPISDCGCFGDALVLTNWQTLWKNVVLLLMAVVVVWSPKEMFRFVSETNQWIVVNYSVLFILAISAWSLYDLPQFDFRPYHIGANIREGMEIPEGAEQPQFETTFILEKNGEQREFTLDNYPDSTWTFVDARTVQTRQGYVPPIHDFSILRDEGEDITEEVLADTGYTFLLVAPYLEKANDSHFELINELYEYSHEHGYPFYCLTASTREAIRQWSESTGAEYPFCSADGIMLKTVIRSNPGLVLLKDATVIGKWSHNNLPVIDEAQTAQPLEQFRIGQMPQNSVPVKVLQMLLWFVLPLSLLTIADRTWAWTKWLRRRKDSFNKPNNKEEKQ
ncbi:MAG: DoxX family protein [Prevotella sp.]|nr:DoxX family protein [Prevotella sp.]